MQEEKLCDLGSKGGMTDTHPLKTGAIVDVLNTTLGGKQIVEGRATIVSPIKNRAHNYNVRFHGDGHRMTYQRRFVAPEQEVR